MIIVVVASIAVALWLWTVAQKAILGKQALQRMAREDEHRKRWKAAGADWDSQFKIGPNERGSE